MNDQPDFGGFTPQPPVTQTDPAKPIPGGQRRRGRQRRAAKSDKPKRRQGRPPKVQAPAASPINLVKVVGAVAGLDAAEAELVISLAGYLQAVTPLQAVRVACALGKLFS